jgi:hypothetical protein
VSSVSARILARISCADLLGDLRRQADSFQILGDVEIGLVERQGLDDRAIGGEDFPDLQGDGLVSVEARFDEDQIGAFSLGGDGRHRGMNPELPRLIACRRHDAAFARSANRDRLAAQLGIIALFHRRVERVHIDMDDFTAAARRGR